MHHRSHRSRFTLALFVACSAAVAVLPVTSSAAVSQSASSSTFVAVLPGLPTTVDPDVIQSIDSDYVLPPLTSTLVDYKTMPPNEAPSPSDVVPALASSWTINSNGSYTFHLRPNVKSAAGNTLTTADVLWSFQRKMAMDPVAQFLMSTANINLKDPITVVSSSTFRLNVTAPSPMVLAVLANFGLTILDKTAILPHTSKKDPWAATWLTTHSASFSAYQVSSFQPSNSLTLTVNPYASPKPTIQTIIMRTVPDSNVRLELMESGQANYTDSLSYSQFAAAAKAKNLKVFAEPDTTEYDGIVLNEKFKPFANKDVREAVELAINRTALVKAIYDGFGVPAEQNLMTAIHFPVVLHQYGYDPSEAKKLLSLAGYPKGVSFSLTACACRPGPYAISEAELLQSQLDAAGFHVTINTVTSPSEFDKVIFTEDASLSLLASDLADPAYFLDLFFTGSGVANYGHYSNSTVNTLVAQALKTPLGAKYDSLLSQALRIVNAAQPFTTLVTEDNVKVYSSNVGGDLAGFGNEPDTFLPAQLYFK